MIFFFMSLESSELQTPFSILFRSESFNFLCRGFNYLLFLSFCKKKQHQRKFVALITDLARVLNEEADASVLLAFE